MKLRLFIEKNFNGILMLSFVFGLFLPGVEHIPSQSVPWILALIIFFSCSKMTMEDVKKIHPLHTAGFYVLRYVLLPFCFYGAALFFIPDLKEAVLLLALMPAGVVVPALCGMTGGNVALGLGLVVSSSFLVPLIVPVVFELVGVGGIELDAIGMSMTLSAIIFIPVILYFFTVRKIEPVKLKIKEWSSSAAVLLIALVITIVIAKEREQIFNDPQMLVTLIIVSVCMTFLFYVFAWFYGVKKERGERISYTLASGASNPALGISLAFMYFSSKIVLFMVLSEVSWIFGVILIKRFLAQREKG